MFHLFTHAFFKALLFLAAGSVMHAMGDVIDMRRFSGLRKVMPTTHWTFLCGAVALAGLPLLSGFWSKDEILGAACDGRPRQSAIGGVYLLLFVVGLVTAGLTAFYTFRAYFLTFWGEVKIPPEAGHHAHESPPVMTVPLMILAVGAVFVGIIVEPFTHWFSHFLDDHWLRATGLPVEARRRALNLVADGRQQPVRPWPASASPGGCTSPSRRWPGPAGRELHGLYQLSLNKFYVDELYDSFIVGPLRGLGRVLPADRSVHRGRPGGPGRAGAAASGLLFRPIQNGLVQFYALAMMLGLTVFLGALVLR